MGKGQMENKQDNKLARRIVMSVVGVLVCGMSVGLFKRAMLGVDPYQSLMAGLNAVIPISFGTLYVIMTGILLIFALVFDRHKIGLATIINMTLLGYVADYSRMLLEKLFPELSLPGRFLMLLAGVVVMCFASAFYFTADLGVSTYDAVALIISQKQDKVKFQFVRIATDFICVALGVILLLAAGQSWSQVGASVGLGTIIAAFFMGPLIAFFNTHVAEPFLAR